MSSFNVLAILTMLLGGAGVAHAALVTVVNPMGFGGFETPGETTSQWMPSPGFNPAVFSIVSDSNSFQGTHYGAVETNSSTTWQYIGLQNLTVQAGATITVQAYVWPVSTSDAFGISYGTSGSVAVTTVPTQTYTFTKANIDYGNYVLVTFTFVATSTNIDIDFGFLDYETTDPMWIDNVSVTYNSIGVPEPASLALLGAALFGLGLLRHGFG